jgi:hypothetical protein
MKVLGDFAFVAVFVGMVLYMPFWAYMVTERVERRGVKQKALERAYCIGINN